MGFHEIVENLRGSERGMAVEKSNDDITDDRSMEIRAANDKCPKRREAPTEFSYQPSDNEGTTNA